MTDTFTIQFEPTEFAFFADLVSFKDSTIPYDAYVEFETTYEELVKHGYVIKPNMKIKLKFTEVPTSELELNTLNVRVPKDLRTRVHARTGDLAKVVRTVGIRMWTHYEIYISALHQPPFTKLTAKLRDKDELQAESNTWYVMTLEDAE